MSAPGGAIAATQIDAYREHGVAVIDEVLDATALAEIRQVVDEFVERSRTAERSDAVLDLGPHHSPDAPQLRRIKDPTLHHPAFATLMRSAGVLDIVEHLLGPNLRFQAGKVNLKHPGGGDAVEWHQDFAFGPCTNDDICTVGIALDDADTENGCLLVVPGSHRGPVLDHHDDEGCFVGAVDPASPDLSRAEPVVVPAGGMSVHHCRTLHGSAPNRSSRPRRLVLFQYAAADAFPIGLVPGPWSTLGDAEDAVVRGRSSSVARLVAMEVRVPDYRKAGGSIYELQERARRADWSAASLDRGSAS